MSSTDSSDNLRSALEKLGAREFEQVALGMDPERALSALEYAKKRGVEHPVPYAIKMFDNADWQPSGERPRLLTNRVVDRRCSHCEGLRFVLVLDLPGLYGETYAPCKECNPKVNTTRWTVGGEKIDTTPL